jgi:hypothetical protein
MDNRFMISVQMHDDLHLRMRIIGRAHASAPSRPPAAMLARRPRQIGVAMLPV